VGHGRVGRWQPPILALDAAGIGLFTVTGTVAALDARLSFVASVVLGMLSGIGGGALSDVLAEVPFVLCKEIYAFASLLGAPIIIAAGEVYLVGTTTNIVAAVATLALRMVSVRRGWNISTARVRER
jgi:uncharacterized membrane protein YeiH